ncbi:hypothetical protein [Amycolatopsis sp. NPDC004169]|uniref:hypothetical protein n=1 Tax=Amycolatopsis sp. NPDC004169 TaxID=3154453 RepID=UPI0033AD05B0
MVDELAQVLGPPDIDPVPVHWVAVERQLGLALPGDYKTFADRYPALFVNEYLRLNREQCS